jgi:O-succinylbenzoic acid--CoA ligase
MRAPRHNGAVRVVEVDGSERSIRSLTQALADALDGGTPVLPVDATAPTAKDVVTAMRPDDPVPSSTAVLIATSGSTGHPKGVLLSAAALTASANATHARLGGPGRWLLATPAQYIGGLQVLVRSVLSGHEPGVLDLSAGFRPEAFAAAAEPVLSEPGPHYTALVPTQLVRLLEAGGPALAAAREFDAIIVGGAALPREVREHARTSGVRAISSYGMTETCGGCVYDGRPLDGVQVRIGPTGRIELSGAVLASGYRESACAPRWQLHDGWFRTEDLGRITDGVLEVLGRADDVINSGGVKVSAPAVEQILRGHPAVRACAVVGIPDAEWGEVVSALVVPTDPANPPSVAELRAHVRAGEGKAAAPKVVRFATELPLRGPGKVDRRAVRDALES